MGERGVALLSLLKGHHPIRLGPHIYDLYDHTLGSKITADGDCSDEIKRHLLLGRKVMTKPRQYIEKQRYCFANKGLSS